MKKRLFLGLVAVLVFAAPVVAAENTGFGNTQEVKTYCETVVKLVMQGKAVEAFDQIENQGNFPNDKFQTIKSQSVKHLDLMKDSLGRPLGVQLVKAEELKDLSLKLTYVIKYDKTILRWVFIFYKPESEWLLNTFIWDDSLEKLYTE